MSDYDHLMKEEKDNALRGTNANNENLPPLPNNATARRFMELVEQYNLSCYEWVEKFWYIGSDLCEAKGSHKWDFANNFLGSSDKYDCLKLRGEDLKAFKKSLPKEKYEKVKFAPSLYLTDWNTAYHYLFSSPVRKEYDFGTILNSVVGWKYEVRTQQLVKVGDRRFFLDFYLPDLNIAIEFDEIQHEYSQEKDRERQKAIQKKLKCKFIRVKEGQEYRALEEISKAVFQ